MRPGALSIEMNIPGSKLGNIAGVSTDVVWPESKLIKDEIEPGRLQTFKFRADKHRWWHPRSTRLSVKYEFKFGEVESTAKDPVKGPEDQDVVQIIWSQLVSSFEF